MERSTLVTKVTIQRADGVDNLADVPTYVETTPRRTIVRFGLRSWLRHVTVTLTEAERIALIEALGGRA